MQFSSVETEREYLDLYRREVEAWEAMAISPEMPAPNPQEERLMELQREVQIASLEREKAISELDRRVDEIRGHYQRIDELRRMRLDGLIPEGDQEVAAILQGREAPSGNREETNPR